MYINLQNENHIRNARFLNVFFSKTLSGIYNADNLIYNYYNIDPNWRIDEKANRILLLEPEIFSKYPVSNRCIQFALKLSDNIHEIQFFSGSFEQLKKEYSINEFVFKEHPLNSHYIGTEDERDWLCKIDGDYLSFFKYWNKIKKKLI